MYSILVTPFAEDASDEAVVLNKDRFLEHTGSDIVPQLRELSLEAQRCLLSWPCLLMREGRGAERAHLAKIQSIHVGDREISVSLRLIRDEAELTNFLLWKLRDTLDIGQFEFNRNHWAVKDRDLLGLLRRSGLELPPSIDSRFRAERLPAPSRQHLLKAKDTIGQWGHTQIENFLLEAGVPGLVAGADLGSRQNRANAILTFALANPSAITAERSLFSAFMVNKAFPDGTNSRDVAPTDLAHSEPEPPARTSSSGGAPASNRVFVVHGQNAQAKVAVVSYLSSLGLRAIVLHEQPNMGRHLLTKFIDEAELATFAVVLLTDDDEGGPRGGQVSQRARQNVILELGYFLSHLGQAKVCALKSAGVETPSDFDGIAYIEMDSLGNWKRELHRELVAAKMPLKGL